MTAAAKKSAPTPPPPPPADATESEEVDPNYRAYILDKEGLPMISVHWDGRRLLKPYISLEEAARLENQIVLIFGEIHVRITVTDPERFVADEFLDALQMHTVKRLYHEEKSGGCVLEVVRVKLDEDGTPQEEPY